MTTTRRLDTRPGGDGPALARDVRGDGLPVVQLHGLSSSRRRDEVFGLDLTAGRDGLRVVRYDARGHGESPGTADPHDYTWPALARDLLALLDEELPGQRVHGVGQSMGSATLLTAAVAEPERFASLTLGIPPTAWQWRREQSRLYELAARQVERWGGARWSEVTRQPPTSPAIDPARPVTAPDVADEWLPAAFRGAAATDLPPREEVARLGMPVLLLAWPLDASHPLEVAEELLELLPDARLEVARTPAEVASWPRVVGDFVRAGGG
ncbi:alpha/beta fold hydrolase [Dietzia maris]|uniref:alpha/beta fold hydrolase n=1 Tax=Dietzia maris TaxID=37915 RepID=UPI00223ACDA0|nr:alpha/beta fold hydrolase [Dietzia maris]MCT1434246.1 alpha/beta fold hydrolase [Dietzia maris]MCT1522686.1 alpha/beta fold hydrolase [Dietzia maris]